MKLKEFINKASKHYDLFYVAVSGGKDSTATLIWTLKHLPKEKILVVFADTGNEAQITLDYIKYLEEKLNIKIHRILPTKTFEQLIEEKNFFPSANIRFCTEILKLMPAKEIIKILKRKIKPEEAQYIKNPEEFEKVISKLPTEEEPKILTITGVRASESEKRSKLKMFEKNNPQIQTDVLRPLLGWKTEKVFKYIKDNELEPNPLYKLGCNRTGCMPCIFAGENEIKLLFENPDFKHDRKRIERLEKITNKKFFLDKTLKEKYNIIKNKPKNNSLFEVKEEEKSICNVNGLAFCE